MMNVRRCANKDYERNVDGINQPTHTTPTVAKDPMNSSIGGLFESGPAKAIPAHYTMRINHNNMFSPGSYKSTWGRSRNRLQPAFHTILERYKRYAATRGWDKTTISWSVRELPPDNSATAMTSSQIMGVIRSAFQVKHSERIVPAE